MASVVLLWVAKNAYFFHLSYKIYNIVDYTSQQLGNINYNIKLESFKYYDYLVISNF